MKRHFTRFVSVAIAALCSLPSIAQGWSYDLDIENGWDGKGTENDPYIITNAQQLANLSYSVNHYGNDFEGEYFVLGADIDLNPGFTFDKDGNITGDGEPQQWMSIGIGEPNNIYFRGNFNGNGYAIKGLYQNESSSSSYWGLFGKVDRGVLKNITIDNSMISIENENGATIGSVCALYNNDTSKEAKETITGCKSNTFIKIKTTGEFSSFYIGGICGSFRRSDSKNAETEIKNCINTGNITIVCEKESAYINYYSYAGGIFGYVSSESLTISDCENNGYITGPCVTGGIFGEFSSSNSVFKDLKNTGDVTGVICGGIAANLSGSSMTKCVNKGNITATKKENCSAGLVSLLSCNTIEDCRNEGTITGGCGLIAGCEADKVVNCSNTGSVTGSHTTYGRQGGAGLMGYLSNLSQDCIFVEMKNCFNTGNITSDDYATGLVNGGSNLYFTQCYNTGNILGKYDAAGIIRNGNNCTIENCYNQGDVKMAGSQEDASENISGYASSYGNASGICIYATNIKYCYNTGKIKGNYSGPICSPLSNDTEVHASYYLEGCVDDATNARGESKTLTEFTSGAVCILLNADQDPTPWGQEIGTDLYPVLSGTGNPDIDDTGICSPSADIFSTNDDALYDLSGRRILKSELRKNGLYISKGKKFIVK